MNTNTMKISRMCRSVALTSLLGLGLMASDASAEILLTRTNINTQGDAVSPFPATYLDLDSASGTQTSLTFSTTTANQTVRIILNAQCSIGGAQTNRFDTTIYVDPYGPLSAVSIPPTAGDNAFCSGNGTATENDGYVSAVSQAFYTVPTSGAHTVRVLVTPIQSIYPTLTGAAWQIRSLSIAIDR